MERTEYDGIARTQQAYQKCAKTWGCKGPGRFAGHASAKTFDDYYKRVHNDHKEHYGKWWDTACKPAYEKNHPPKAPAGKK